MREVTGDPVEQDDDEESQQQLKAFFESKLTELRIQPDGSLPAFLDYRHWFDYQLHVKVVGTEGEGIENASYGATICAERTAVANMVSSGHTDPVAIAICYNETEFALPCGICRQVLSEFADQNEDLVVLMAKLDGTYRETTLSNLLPGAFKLIDSKK